MEMVGPASSSGSSAISGLGITFCPSPDPSALRDHLANNPPAVFVAQQYPDARSHASLQDPRLTQPQFKRIVRGSVSYDGGMNQYYLQTGSQAAQVMIREDSGDSSAGSAPSYHRHQHPRPNAIPIHHQQYHQKQKQLHQPNHLPSMHGLHAPQVSAQYLSPMSEFEASDSDSQLFSPSSLSSLPSSSGLEYTARYDQGYSMHPQLRHAQSMSALPFSAPWLPPHVVELRAAPNPVPIKQHVPYLRAHPRHDMEMEHGHEAEIYPGSRSPSRLPQFLQERIRRQAMTRAQSMVELGKRYAQQEPSHLNPNEAIDEEERHEFEGNASPESVPSSAGGLQRRHLERRLKEQHDYIVAQTERERSHRLSTAVVDDDDRGPPVPRRPTSFKTQANRLRSKSMSATDRLPSGEVEAVVEKLKQQKISDLRKSDMGARRRSLEDSDATDASRAGVGTVSSAEREDVTTATVMEDSLESTAVSLQRQGTLMTAGANPFRRSMELDRLLAPGSKRAAPIPHLATIADSPALSSGLTTSSAASPAWPRARSNTSSSALVVDAPAEFEQGLKSSTKTPRVELDLLINSSLLVEGGLMKGRVDVRVRRNEVYISKPKVRVVGFEELACGEARHVFYHHAAHIESTTIAKDRSLPFCDPLGDDEGFHKGRLGEHAVPFAMSLPVGKGAKGGWKCKQGVVRYIVIASVKLKSKHGSDRSIAHFYRHVDIFPYYNPAILLAPSPKPHTARASKSLFMGGSGKVNLEASLHRQTWVAGQRCYVEIRVENESNRKIKSLTLSLLRNTVVLRSGAKASTSSEGFAELPFPSQSTRKKVAETTLEMGKKGSKGVTAKGNWLGVEAGETADFSHSLIIPNDELSIARGRHLEVSFVLKVAAGSSLSGDVSAEIPIRIVNFVSLDPPPGHLGSASPLPQTEGQPLAKDWGLSETSAAAPRASTDGARPSAHKMPSVDSLQLSDLIEGPTATRTIARPRLSRVPSVDSIDTESLSRAQSPIPDFPAPPQAEESAKAPEPPVRRGQVIVGKAIERQLTHQMSLECISSAIASATARRPGHQRQESGLRSVESYAEIERWEDTGDLDQDEQENEDPYYAGGGEKLFDGPSDPFQASHNTQDGIQLDDLDEVPDDMYGPLGQLPDAFSSEEELKELNAVMHQQKQSHFSDDDDELDHEAEDVENEVAETAHSTAAHRPARPRSVLDLTTQESIFRQPESLTEPSTRSRSPTKPTTTAARTSQTSDVFAFATLDSPIKAKLDAPTVIAPTLASPRSPVRRQPSKAALQVAAESETKATRGPRPLPVRPTATSSTLASPTKASMARAELNKKASMSSLKRSPGVVRRASNKSLAEAYETSSVAPGQVKARVSLAPSPRTSIADHPTSSTSALPSPRISVVAPIDSPRSRHSTMAPPLVPRKVRHSPSSPNLRSPRSMGDLRAPVLSRRTGAATAVLPSVRNKVAALETRSATLHVMAGTVQGSSFLSRDPVTNAGAHSSSRLQRGDSIRSEVSDATTAGFAGLHRAESLMSFKAPILRRKQ
ncbi:BZ3500_MvSof-1268-A1-R1_Chr4-3g07389 [Microbotryum saponariae]|uniref:BZ3500_MvSof-1268-A1-R1_Chr4-3g07389 protein n=1 Tax=Microbotryum saponariae TaxID=289078 RepID=A0A2X0MY10_9BASI|nr:BZ3500_MvSof-1268-A1-R1_Chr4-3g07389 [Microbotryum saponariae]SDA07052.1 BZ3501_MvSof-1269-A2-R1_Chr4-2g07098 [Microbotryum saponariae]